MKEGSVVAMSGKIEETMEWVQTANFMRHRQRDFQSYLATSKIEAANVQAYLG